MMNQLGVFKAFVPLFYALLSAPAPAAATTIEELVGGAKKEGVIELYAPSTLTPQGAQALGEAFNKNLHEN
jgi:hypothetical protein